MILDCRNIKKQELLKLKMQNHPQITLVVITIGKFLESAIYLKNKKKLATDLNVKILELAYDDSHSKKEIMSRIMQLNKDSKITGIMIQKPILPSFSFQELIDCIDYWKDVEGLTTKNKKLLTSGVLNIVPCTARAVLKVLEEYQVLLVNRKIAIIGKSDLVGMPLYHILKKDNFVTLCDSKTENLREITINSDIVITAIGKANYFTKEYFRDGQVIIDVGTNYLDGNLVGDVNFKEVQELDVMITPVPGGVGQLTPVYLYSNLFQLDSSKIDKYKKTSNTI